MSYFIGCDAHKKYSVFVAVDEQGQAGQPARVGHERDEFRRFLQALPPASPIALEATGYWYWMVDEMEQGGHRPILADAKKAKLLMGCRNKTDKLDARGLAVLLRNGTLPAVWIADARTRDTRELSRMRMQLVGIQTKLKNRIQACFSRYGIVLGENADVFGAGGRRQMTAAASQLPPQTRYAVHQQLQLLDAVGPQIAGINQQIQQVVRQTPEMKLLRSLPGVGWILSAIIALEIGDIGRFGGAPHLVSYAGLVPRVYSSGGRTRHGSIAPDVNRVLRWAFVEAAQVVIRNRDRRGWQLRRPVQLYHRVAAHHPPQVATVAVARQLAESAFWVLKKQEGYREPRPPAVLSSSR